MRTIHVLEPQADGHRMQYVRRILSEAPPDLRMVLSTFEESLEHPACRAALEARDGRVEIRTIAGGSTFRARVAGKDGFRLQPAYWNLFRRHWATLAVADRGDLVVVPYLDYCSYAMGLLGSPFGATPVSGVLMRPDFHWAEQGVVAPPSQQSGLKRWLFLRLLRNRHVSRLVTIDPSLRDWVGKHRPKGHERLGYVDDPSDMHGEGDSSAGRRHFGLDEDDQVILLFGAIDPRKGLRKFLEVLANQPSDSRVRGLVVGRLSPSARDLLENSGIAASRIVCVDRYVDAQEEWLAFQTATWIWVAYEGFYGPSGVLAQAAQVGKPILHNGQGLIGYMARITDDRSSLGLLFGDSSIVVANAYVANSNSALGQVLF